MTNDVPKFRPAISQICTLNSSFEEDLKGYAEATGAAVEFWLTKLEEYLKSHTPQEVREFCEERFLVPAAASYHGGLLLSQGDARREGWSQFERRLDLCRALKIPTLVITPDFLGPFSMTDVERAQFTALEAAKAAGDRGVRLALEFQAKGTFLNNLQTAVGFVGAVGHPALGICLDVFQYYLGPSKHEDLGLLSARNLYHVHFSDLADTPREIASDADRIMPGDGDFQLQPIVQRLCNIDYDGYVSLELHNPTLWKLPARQVGEIGLTCLRMVLGLADPPR